MLRRERIQGDSALSRSQVILAALDGFQAELWTALPGVVTKVNITHNPPTVEVQPAIMAILRAPDGSTSNITMPLCVDVPIHFVRAGGFSITVPVIAGTEGLLIFSSRCIDAWWQNGCPQVNGSPQAQPQIEQRMHDLSDAIFIPGIMSQASPIVNGISLNALQIRTDDAASFMELTLDHKMRIVAPGGITINGVTIDVNGDVASPANVTAKADITAGLGTADQVGLRSHKHPTAGTGAPSPPTPGT